MYLQHSHHVFLHSTITIPISYTYSPTPHMRWLFFSIESLISTPTTVVIFYSFFRKNHFLIFVKAIIWNEIQNFKSIFWNQIRSRIEKKNHNEPLYFEMIFKTVNFWFLFEIRNFHLKREPPNFNRFHSIHLFQTGILRLCKPYLMKLGKIIFPRHVNLKNYL